MSPAQLNRRRSTDPGPTAALAAMVAGQTGWMIRGTCNGKATRADDPWFSETDQRAQIASAKRICARCPVAVQCLNYALDAGEAFGVWGGTTARQRQAMARRGDVA